MQDVLVPILGEYGAIIAHYVIVLGAILGLIVFVVEWVIRHYGGSRPATRARPPRLAIVDTLAIDNKRRLVLVRRDSVEHLVLLGGPSDIVLESIVRQRVAQQFAGAARPPPQPPPPHPPPPAAAPQANAPAAPRVLPSRAPFADGEMTEAPIPFPPRRMPLYANDGLGSRRTATRTSMAASAVDASEPLSGLAFARRMAMAAIEEEQPTFPDSEPASARFAPPRNPLLEEPVGEPTPDHLHQTKFESP